MRPPSVISVTTNDGLTISPSLRGQQTKTNNNIQKDNNLKLINSDSDGNLFNKSVQYQEQEEHNIQKSPEKYHHHQLLNKQNVDVNCKNNDNNILNHLTKNISKNHTITVNPLSNSNINNCVLPTSSSDFNLKYNTSDLDQYFISECGNDNFIIKNKKPLSDYTISTNRNRKNIIVNKLSEVVNSNLISSTSSSSFDDFEKKPLIVNNLNNSNQSVVLNLNCDSKKHYPSNNFVQRRVKNKQNFLNRRSLPHPINYKTEDTNKRRQQVHSWYAPGYEILTEVAEPETGDNVSFFSNLAGTRGSLVNGTLESASLLENQNNQSIPTIQSQRSRRSDIYISLQQQNQQTEGPHTSSFGGPSQPTRRVGKFLRSLYSRSKQTNKENNFQKSVTPPTLLSSTDLNKDCKLNSEKNLVNLAQSSRQRGVANSTTSLNIVNQKLWSVVPLLRRENSCSSLNHTSKFRNYEQNHLGLRKCNTVSALSQSTSSSNSGGIEPIKPLNRLRNYTSIGTCSRCSSILSLAAAGSKYSLNLASGGGFIPIDSNDGDSTTSIEHNKIQTKITVSCKLCLGEVKIDKLTKISHCGCSFCTECMTSYVEFEILEGAYEISCPDAMCPSQGILTVAEIMLLASNSLMEKHQRYRLNREVELDVNRTWCPKAGCETVCLVGPSSIEKAVTIQPSSSHHQAPCSVHCPTCEEDFCSGCKKTWHPTMSCEENLRRLAADGVEDLTGIPFDSDLIKCCPMCSVPIEKDEGCAQMMCKRCKHVFCWYCLASLDDDFLLRHYDKGPCKNKLGHSRASVVWHRAQVIGIFAGFGILLLVASPLLLLAAPCIVCCKCRICSGAAKLDETEQEYDDLGVALQR